MRNDHALDVYLTAKHQHAQIAQAPKHELDHISASTCIKCGATREDILDNLVRECIVKATGLRHMQDAFLHGQGWMRIYTSEDGVTHMQPIPYEDIRSQDNGQST